MSGKSVAMVISAICLMIVAYVIYLSLYSEKQVATNREIVQAHDEVLELKSGTPLNPKALVDYIQTEPVDVISQEFATLKTMARPNWKLDTPFKEHVEQLTKSYNKGDLTSGFILAANYLHCDRAPRTEDDLRVRLERVSEYSDADNASVGLINKFNYCEGISDTQRRQHLNIMMGLSNKAYTPALEITATIPDKVLMATLGFGELAREEFIAKQDEMKALKYQYLHLASKQGSLRAIARLGQRETSTPILLKAYSNIYDNSEKHTVISMPLANALVLMHFSEDNDVYSRAQFLHNRYIKVANAEEREKAYDLADSLIQKIEQNGELYPVKDDKSWQRIGY